MVVGTEWSGSGSGYLVDFLTFINAPREGDGYSNAY